MNLSSIRSGRRRRCATAVCVVMLAATLLVTASAEAKGRPHLKKAGIACGKESDGSGEICLLYILAKNAGRVEWRYRGAEQSTFHQQPKVFAAWQWYGNPVRKHCLIVKARATNKRGSDKGKVRLCDVGHGLESSTEGDAWKHAKYRRF